MMGGVEADRPLRDIAIVVAPPDTAEQHRTHAAYLGLEIGDLSRCRLYHLQGSFSDDDVARLADAVLIDAVGGQWTFLDNVPVPDGFRPIETGLLPGVTDAEGSELVRAAERLEIDVTAASAGWLWLVPADLDDADLERLATEVCSNPVIERWSATGLGPAYAGLGQNAAPTRIIALDRDDVAGWAKLNVDRRLGLQPIELAALAAHAADRGRSFTDAEIEMLAQTWSEHCSHKTFRAVIHTDNGDVDGLLKSYLRAATDEIGAPWVRSAFVDNAGIVRFDDDTDVALKAETHNHPSALEPFGGANTGVGGVVRDILGVSARPIAITDVLCFGPDHPVSVPDGVLHPRRIRDGVVAGVGDYGNKIGVPNVAGAIVVDDRYLTTPLVFAGCIGALPNDSNPTNASAGDAIVVLGGAVGRDGVGGATFSSMNMEAATAEVAGSAVQIGAPITEKGLIDVIEAARDQQLYTAITDCGAGGLSSAVGEMAETLGATVDLDLVPRKYPGLSPWEVWLSEAQERMVVATADAEPLLKLAERWGVDAAVIGSFTGDGRLMVRSGIETVIDLDCKFLHDGRPRLELTAGPTVSVRPERERPEPVVDPAEMTLRLLAHPSLQSHEAEVRTYDHEVGGATVRRPYGGPSGHAPADGNVVMVGGPTDNRGLAIGVGVNPLLGDLDAEAMAWSVIDEAVRNVVCAGGDPSELSLLDNFAWGDPNNPELLGRLVAACRGCHDAALAYGAPFVSGKDSLFNQFRRPDGTADPVASTLVITAVAPVADVDRIPSVGPLGGGEIWLIGPTSGSLGGSHFDAVIGADRGGSIPGIDPGAPGRAADIAAAIVAGVVRSVADVAEGGLARTAAEWAFAGDRGLQLDLDADFETLFGEGPGRYLVEVDPSNAQFFEALVPDARPVGRVDDGPGPVRVGPIELDLERVAAAYLHGDVG